MRENIELLAEIAKSQPQAAYIGFTKGYKSKFAYFMRTIDNFEDYVEPIDEVINDSFLPALFGLKEPLPDELRDLFTLPPAQGGLGILDLKVEAPQQYAASKSITASHASAIRTQSNLMPAGEQSVEDLKRQQQSLKTVAANLRREATDASLPPDLLRSTMQARDKGASSWLNAVPNEEQGLTLNKQQFRDSLRLRYNLQLADRPSHCSCGDRFSVSHALSCKKGGFVSQRHDGILNLLTSLLSKVCKNVEVEPHLLPIDNEIFGLRSTVTSPEARLDIKAGSFWSRGKTAFFDVRVTHVNSASNQKKSTEAIFMENEKEKKRKYQQRVIDVEMGSFTPLVFGTNGGMGNECKLFLSNLADKLSRKNGEPYARAITWLRTRISFEILRSVHTCVRGSRTPFHNNPDFLDDFSVNIRNADIS